MVLFYHPLATWADLCLIKAEEVEGMGEVALERPSGKADLHSLSLIKPQLQHALPSSIMQADVGDEISHHQQKEPLTECSMCELMQPGIPMQAWWSSPGSCNA